LKRRIERRTGTENKWPKDGNPRAADGHCDGELVVDPDLTADVERDSRELQMSPDTQEVESIVAREQHKMQDELREIVRGLKETADRIDDRMKNLVDEKLCRARTDGTQAMINGITASVSSLVEEFKGFRAWAERDVQRRIDEAVARANAESEIKTTERLEAASKKVSAQLEEVTHSMHAPPRSKPVTKEIPPLLERMSSNAKALVAIYGALVLLGTTCVGGAYYVVGAANVLKSSVAEQKQLLVKQTAVAKEISQEAATPIIRYYVVPPDAGTSAGGAPKKTP